MIAEDVFISLFSTAAEKSEAKKVNHGTRIYQQHGRGSGSGNGNKTGIGNR